jgi:general secretion pathway protein G
MELIFVIVIIGILTAIAVPKFTGVAKSAYVSKGKNTLAIVRSAIATEKQKKILKGDYNDIVISNDTGRVFTQFDDENGTKILDNDLPSCSSLGCWYSSNAVDYTFHTDDDETCTYKLENNHFVDKTNGGCKKLEE